MLTAKARSYTELYVSFWYDLQLGTVVPEVKRQIFMAEGITKSQQEHLEMLVDVEKGPHCASSHAFCSRSWHLS